MSTPTNERAVTPEPTTYTLPSATGMHFPIDGGEPLQVDIIDALRQMWKIRQHCLDQKLSTFEHVDMFGRWIKERTGRTLTSDQIDSLWDACDVEYARRKKVVRVLLGSLNSTELAPSSSPTENELDCSPI